MLLKTFNNKKIVNIKGQVVTKKSPFWKIFLSSALLVGIIFLFMEVQPDFSGWRVFKENLGRFFDFSDFHKGLRTYTITETFFRSLDLLWKTILYSLLGTVIGIFLSVPLALVSSKNITKKSYIYMPFRILMSLIRSIPPLIIAYLMFNVFTKSLSAVIALSVFVTSIMTKWLYEELDSIDLQAFDSLTALGNQKPRSITKSVFPYLMKSIVSYGIYAFEMVLRFAAILGVVGIVTIGYLISYDFRSIKYWGHLSIVLWVLITGIIIIESLTVVFKKYILEHKNKSISLNKKDSVESQIAYMKVKSSKFWIIKLIMSLILMALVIYSIIKIEWGIASEIKLEYFKQGMKDFFNPDWTHITTFGNGSNAIETGGLALLVSIAAVFIGLLFSLIFGLLASKNFTGKYFSWFFRCILISIRSIPGFVYAIMFVFLAPESQMLFVGVLALGVHSIGMLGKLTYEKIDSIDLASRQALEVMGTSRIISTRWGILKEALPTIISNAIYRIEINFKSTVQLGAVGASAFGNLITTYSADVNQFSKLSPFIIVTMVIVLVFEQISNLLRKKIMKGYFVSKNNFISKWIQNMQKQKAIINAKAFNLEFKNSIERIKYINYVSKKLKLYEENREIYHETKQKFSLKKTVV